MTSTLEWIKARRSIRKFTAEPVSDEHLDMLLQAAMAAPTACNRKPWEYVVVSEQETLARLKQVLRLGRYDAPAAIVVCGNLLRTLPPPTHTFWIQDCSAAMQNILLEATGLGLGAVWVGIHPVGLFKRGVAKVLDLPKNVQPLGLVHVGYPAEERPARTQYDTERIHWQGW